MLENHLIPKTEPIACDKQVYSEPNLRITVLTPRLIRVEVGKEFIDLATQIVWFRNFEHCPFEVIPCNKDVIIKTSAAEFFFCNSVKRITHVTFPDGKKVKTADAHEFNLKGTVRSLDNSMGQVKLRDGIMSKLGVAVMEDNSLLLGKDGLLKPRQSAAKDFYIFAHGTDYRGALCDFYKITGPVPLIPRAALGNWWSRWKAYTQDEYIALMHRFKSEGIPFSMATIDMDWHIVNVKKHFPDYKTEEKSLWRRLIWGDGWTGYTWNHELFPDYKGFLKWLRSHGYSTILNLHPASGVRWFEDRYTQMAEAVGINPETRETVKFNMADPRFVNAYFRVLHKPYEKEGVDYWWVDWQQGRKSQLSHLDPLWALNHYHTLAVSESKRPFILSRFAGPGSHRYPIGFSGDTMSNWRVLRFQPYFTATAANIGYTWWSHDIGGHWGGVKNDELYLRWLQFGIYSPINRLHSTRNEMMGKEVWNYRPDVEHYARRLLTRRHKMIPYIYTMNYRTHTQGIPICEPLYYQYPNKPEAYKYRNQYFFGQDLMVCPITKKSSSKMALSTVKVWLPEGRWTDITTDRYYEGNREIVLAREIHEIPVFARAGAIIPRATEEECFHPGLPKAMDIYIYRGTNTFGLYEDNGVDRSHEQGNFAITNFSVKEYKNNLIFEISPATGQGIDLLPSKRKYKIILQDISVAESVTVRLNDRIIKPTIKTSPISIRLDGIKPKDKVHIVVTGFTPRKNHPFNGEVVRLFSRLSLGNMRKNIKFRQIKNLTDNKKKFVRRMKRMHIPKALKLALHELVLMEN